MGQSFERQIMGVSQLVGKGDTSILQDVCTYLKLQNPRYNWVGIYIIDGSNLRLETFVGKPTEHILIPIGNGLCGKAISKKEVINEPDVGANSEYLACSLETKSELVVPIWYNEEPVGEIDIDSDMSAAFNRDDELFIEHICHLISEIVGVRSK